MARPTAIDIFCGAGGLSEGFRQAGFAVLVGNDIDKAAAQTFKATHKEAVFLEGPIGNWSAADFLKAATLKRGELDVLIGGPPCQGFSVYNHQRGMHDERSSLYLEYLRIVEGLLPKWVVLENVTGITSAGDGAAVNAIVQGFEELGYRVEAKILKAEEYGIPQERRRIVFLGTRTESPIQWPEKTHGPGLKPFVTVDDAIGDLPPLENGASFKGNAYIRPPVSDYQKELRNGATKVLNHFVPKLGDINLRRLEHIPPGGSWRDIPIDLLPAGMKRAKRSDHTKRYGRLRWEGLSSTILTKCDIHWGAYIHPSQQRSISVREAARFQSFPDWFEFSGSQTEQYVQIGNAVPPLLGRAIAKAIKRASTRGEMLEKLEVALAG
ncbi:DNA cytosine methyltransferase [uncultured Hoeflea sp.]|uniref:DNA cytosine methyltransferase n=1 Tax=uncultured Hoeflea sp. TaxID=538666 RepID=UPI0030EE2860|tara:strand:+ start:177078 stop:178220 length:1143 start_codon:yes stop_codon:yes gene_type:complete